LLLISVVLFQQHLRGICEEEGGAERAEAGQASDGQTGRQEEGQRDVGKEQNDPFRSAKLTILY
jgi:hypothetical protein